MSAENRKNQIKSGDNVDKGRRQRLIVEVIAEYPIANQHDLVSHLAQRGVKCTQASISRDISELGLVKIEGTYRLPEVRKTQSGLVDGLTAEKAGDHLIVLRTGPGVAQAAALMIDRAKMSGLIGTVAGDDTIFLAVRSAEDQNAVIRQVFALFNRS